MSSSVQTLSNWNELSQALTNKDSKLVVLEFMSPSSEPCKFMKPKLESLANDQRQKADFYALEVNKFKWLAERFRVEALPKFLLVHKFYVKDSVVGIDKDELKSAIDKVYEQNIR